MKILCVKVIWEAEALIFQSSPGKFMSNLKPNIWWKVFTEGFNYLLIKLYFCFATAALFGLSAVIEKWADQLQLSESVKVSYQQDNLLNKVTVVNVPSSLLGLELLGYSFLVNQYK